MDDCLLGVPNKVVSDGTIGQIQSGRTHLFGWLANITANQFPVIQHFFDSGHKPEHITLLTYVRANTTGQIMFKLFYISIF